MGYLFNEKDKQQLTQKLMEKVTKFQEYTTSSGIANGWQKNKDFYENRFFSEDSEDLDILNTGEQGEILA